MKPRPFALERYFAKYEFSVKHLFSSSDCDGLPMAEVLALADDETRALWEGLRLGYTEEPGHPLLRAEIAGTYEGISAGQVLTGAPEELVFVAMNCLLEPGDHVVCTFPAYQSLYEIARTIGCEITPWRPSEEQGWRFDPAELRAAVRPSTKLIVVNFPHNPTGYLPPRADFEEVVAIAAEHGVRLFSDEMYRGLEVDPGERLPSACELSERSVSLSGMSKVYGMAGTRIGWLVVRDAALYEQMVAFKDYTTICSSAPSEVLALIGLRARQAIVDRHRQRIARNAAVIDELIATAPLALRWVRPRAGTIGLIGLPSHVNALELAEKVVAETGVMIVPSTMFDYGDAHVRVGLGRESLPEVAGVLRDYLTRTYR